MRRKTLHFFIIILIGSAPAFSFTLSGLAQNDYKIMDLPLIEGIAYFQSTIFSFYRIARILGTFLGLVCILWNVFRLWFGTEAVKKACIDIITKFMLFIFLFNSYPLIVDNCINLAINIGMRAGGGLNTVNTKFFQLREDYEKRVSKAQMQLEQILADAAPEARISESLIADLVKMTYPDDTDVESLKNKYHFETVDNDGVIADSWQNYGYSMDPAYYENVSKNKKQLITNIKQFYKYAAKINSADMLKDENLGDAVVTLRAMNEVFYLNKEYDPAVDDPVAKYLFNPFLTDENGKQTNLLSPSAMIKVGILISDIISHRGSLFYDKENNVTVTKKLNFMEVALHSLQEFLFSIIMTLGLICACVFCSIQYVMCIFEYFIVTSVGVIFIPFCLWDGTKSFAAKLVTLFTSYFIKIMVMVLCLFWVYGMLLDMGMAIMTSDNPLALINLGHFIFACLLAWVVTQNGPQIAVTILNGSPQLSMGEFLHAAGTAVAGAMAARSAVKAGAGALGAGHKAMQGGVRGVQTAAAAWKGAGAAIDANEPDLTQGQRFSRQVAATGKMALNGLKHSAATFFTGQEPKGESKGGFTAVGKGHSAEHSTKSGAKSYGDSVKGAETFTNTMYQQKAAASAPTLDASARNSDKNFQKPSRPHPHRHPTGKPGKHRGDS
jgi:type IV secretion system protein TrbL